MILNREQLRQAIEEKGLVQEYVHLDTQLQPNGFDVTVSEIHRFKNSGKLDFSNSEREIPETEKIEPEKKNEGDEYGWWSLEPGTYKIVMNEKVDIPEDTMALAFPRSSLLRMGCTTENAVWDSGYTGKGSFKLSVDNQEGVEIKENARMNQLVFIRMEETEEGYSGRYHEEKV